MNEKLPADLISLLKSGRITVHQNNKKIVEVDAKDNNVTVNITDLFTEINTTRRVITKLSEARTLADLLKKRGVTLTLSSHNKPIVRLGLDAKPKLSRLLTRSGDVEVTNLRELRRLDRRLRTG